MTEAERTAAEKYMEKALALAESAAKSGEVPVGAVVVKEGEIIGCGSNHTVSEKDPTAHAEMEAVHEALKAVGGWRLTGCDIYVTLEPCAMCAGALVNARIKNIYIGTPDPKSGACGSVLDVTGEKMLNHHPAVHIGILQERCAQILRDFFRELRRK